MDEMIPCSDGTLADPSVGCVTVPNGIVDANSSVTGLLMKWTGGLLSLVIMVATISLIYGALHWATSAGNEEQVEKAKRILYWSVFGLLLGLGAKYGVWAIGGMMN